MSIWTAEEDGSEVSDRPNLSFFEGTAAFVHAAFRNATRPSVPVTVPKWHSSRELGHRLECPESVAHGDPFDDHRRESRRPGGVRLPLADSNLSAGSILGYTIMKKI